MLIQANAIHIPLPDGVVQTIVTSPPYWAKRAYVGRQQAVVWPGVRFDMPGGAVSFPGDPHCAPPGMRWLVENGYREPQHDWGDELPARPNTPKRDHAVDTRGVKVAQGFGHTRGTEAYRAATSLTSPTMGRVCRRCGAWRGALGHEPDPLMFIGHLVLFLRECWRVLRPDGTLWINVADSSHGSWGNYGARRGKQRQRTTKRWQRPAYEGQHGYKALPPTPQPSGFGVSVNDGALYTNDTSVTVRTWAPNVTHVRLSNDGGYADEGWMTYQVTQTWVISTYGSYVLPRYVYAWFKDEQAMVYGSYLDDIIYDPVPPQGNLTLSGSAGATVTLNLEAQDDNSGVAQMRVGETDLSSASWQPYTTSITWTQPSAVVYVQFKDRAGNESPLYGSDGSEHWLETRPLSVTLDGPTLGLTNTAQTFTADVLPLSATLPITYNWQVTGYEPITHANTMRSSDALSFTWDVTGVKTIAVTALNGLGTATGTHSVTIVGATPRCARPLRGVDIQGPGEGTATLYVGTSYVFYAALTPTDATSPITYTWAPMPVYGQGLSTAIYQWDEPDTYTVTLTAENCIGIPFAAQSVVTVQAQQYYIYLPLILRD